uniref:AAA family ATPase n=1 Tax=Actinomyces sp. 217892 TaxID=2927827 RepID=UPI00202F28B6
MIESLHIEDLGVIERADLRLSPGLTALTGETGAGKTMVLTSLGLLLGQRAESTIVRTGTERTLVEGTFALDPGSRAAQRALDAGAELDDDLLIASRTVPATGRSRAHLGGRSVPSGILTEVGAQLVSVHGQADQLRLRSASAQRAALDSLGGSGHTALCRRYAEAYRALQRCEQDLADWQADAEDRAAEAARLRHWLEAVEETAPQPGEDAALTLEAERLDHAEDLRLAAGSARTALAGAEDLPGESPDVLALIAHAERALAPVADIDPVLAELAGRARQLSVLAADTASDLGEYLASLDADPARLAWVQDRRGELARLLKEVGGPEDQVDDVDTLLAFCERAAERLAR